MAKPGQPSAGVTVTAPPDIVVRIDGAAGPDPGKRGPVRPSGPVALPQAPADAALDDALVAAIRGQGIDLIQTLELGTIGGTRRSGGADPAHVAVDVGANEDAVLLVEQDGVYQWIVADAPGIPARRGRAPTGRTVAFTVPLTPPDAGAAGRRSLIGDIVLGRIKAWVFRFVAHAVVAGGAKLVESHVVTQLVQIAGLDPAQWSGAPAPLKPPSGRAARVLVLVHGTFSSTAGGYAALGATPWGQAFLQACQSHYDAVIGFDHRTLANTPRENALAMLAALRGQDWGALPPVIDFVAHSRGALVVRSLVEDVGPGSGWGAVLRRAVLVGGTNGGTELAEPGNWSALADVYTNLAVAACRALAVLPHALPVSVVLREMVSSVGTLVKELARGAIDGDGALPGLAAMQPTSRFLAELNSEQPGQPAAAASMYYVITASFAARLGGDHEPHEFSCRLVELLAGGLVGQLMGGAANDLVVGTASMSAIDRTIGDFVRDVLHFEASPDVYHTNYFARPEVVNALARWLEVPAPQARRSLGSEAGRQPGPQGLPDLHAMSGLPGAVDPEIIVHNAGGPAAELLDAMAELEPSYVVLHRMHEGRRLSYAFQPGEIDTALGTQPHATVQDALNLRESQSLDTATVADLGAAPEAGPRRSVILDEGRAVGVMPASDETLLGSDLGALVRRMQRADQPGLLRRAMPSFAPPSAPTPMVVRPFGLPMPAPAAEPLLCHFMAEAAPKVKLGGTLKVHVAISREQIERAVADTVAQSAVPVVVDPHRKIIVEVWPKRGFDLPDDDEPTELDPPGPGAPLDVYFTLKAAEAGKGEIWVVARQRRMPLVTLKLFPEVVTTSAKPSKPATGAAATLVVTAQAAEATGQPPAHKLTIWEQQTPAGTIFRFELSSQSLNLLNRYQSAPIIGDRRVYAENLYARIEARWTKSGMQAAAFARELRFEGADLWKELLPEALRRDLWANRDQLSGIFILSEEPFVPWELLFIVEPGQAAKPDGKFLAELGVVRWLYDAEASPPTEIVVRKGRARYVIPSYPAIPAIELRPLPEAQNEIAFLEQHLAAMPVTPLPDDVDTLMSGPGAFDLLHFAGHGAAAAGVIDEAQIMLAGETRAGSYVPNYLGAKAVSGGADFGGGRPMVVLNACQAGRLNWKLTGLGGFAQAFLSRKAGAFIGTLWSVGDDTARDFTEALYTALLSGMAMAEAVKVARAAAKKADDPTWLAYVVYAHPAATLRLR